MTVVYPKGIPTKKKSPTRTNTRPPKGQMGKPNKPVPGGKKPAKKKVEAPKGVGKVTSIKPGQAVYKGYHKANVIGAPYDEHYILLKKNSKNKAKNQADKKRYRGIMRRSHKNRPPEIGKGGGGGGSGATDGKQPAAEGAGYAEPDTGTTSMLRSQGKAYAAGRTGIGNYEEGATSGGGLSADSGGGGGGGAGKGRGRRGKRPKGKGKRRGRGNTKVIIKVGGKRRGPARGKGKRAPARRKKK